ncbi:MAG: hypothetical protein JST50_02520 [Bacteroidetes bacterium]|nr:hypothetical protein [Bacteroidota bacterium]
MACIKLTCIFLLLGTTVRAQTFAEWFNQKSTQKKYLYQQIAALQVYSSYLQKGYHIARNVLGSISGYIGNEYGLHSSYYAHLKTVNAPVKNNPQVNDILRWQQDILTLANQLKGQKGLNGNEAVYVSKVCDALLSDCDARLNDLQIILADQKTEMSDEERIRQIARLHRAMQDNYRVSAGFQAQLQLYVRNKQQEIQDVTTLNRLYANR